MRTEDFYLKGLDVVVPEVVTVDHALEQDWCSPEQARLHDLTGAAVAGDRSAPDMALEAARGALRQSGDDPRGLGLMLYADTWHQGPDGWFPQYYLQHHLPTEDALSLEVRQGCNAMLCATELAYTHTRSAPGGTALIVGAENYNTPRIDRWRSAGFPLGDGASAMVVGRETGFAQILSAQSLFVPALEGTHRFGEPMFPPGATTGGPVELHRRETDYAEWCESRPDLTLAWMTTHHKLMKLLRRVIAEAEVDFGDIRYAAFANLGPEDHERYWLEMLGLPEERTSWAYTRNLGHIGGNDCMIGLHHLIGTGKLSPGDHVFLGSVASGVTLSGAVLKLLEVPELEPPG